MATPDQIHSWLVRYAADGTRARVVAGALARLGTPWQLARERAEEAIAEAGARTLARFAAEPAAFDAMATGAHYAHFANYVTRAALNWATTRFGRQAGAVPLPDDVLGLDGPDPDRLLDVRVALAELPAADRELLRLRYDEGLTLQEIAALQGCSLSHVWQRLRHLHELLKTRLGPGA